MKAPTVADYPDEPYLYEQVHGQIRYENDGTGWLEVRARLRVQTPAGLDKVGQLVFSYNAENQRLEIRRVRVTKPDGSVVTAGADAVLDLSSSVAREAPKYTDARQKHVTVPRLAVGDVVEYDVVTTTFQPLLAKQFWQIWNFISDAICFDEQVALNIPRERAITLKSPAGLEPSVRDEGDRRIYRWAGSTLHYANPLGQVDKFKFDPATLLQGYRPPQPRQILLSTYSSWKDVGEWYATLERDRRVVTPEIQAMAEEIVRGESTDTARAQAIYRWVSRNIRYVSLSFGIGRYQPHKASEVLLNRYGDCKDKTALLESLLEAIGLHAQAALVNSRANVDTDVPTPLQFDHVITFVRLDGRDHWLDSTLGVGPFDYLLPQLRGKQALVVFTRDTPALRSTPQDLQIPTIYRIDVKAHLNGDKTLTLGLGFQTRGDLEVFARAAILKVPPTQLNLSIQQAAAQASKSSIDGFSLSDFKADDPTDTRNPYHAEIQVHGKLSEAKLNNTSATDLMSAFGANAPINSQTILSLLPAVESRYNAGKLEQQAVKLDGPKEYSLTIEFTAAWLQDSASVKPAHITIRRDFAEYESSSSWEGQTFHGSWRLSLRAHEVSKSEAKEYAAFCQQVAESFDSSPFFSKPTAKTTVVTPSKDATSSKDIGKPQPPHVPPAEALALFNEAQADFNRQEWANAEKSFGSIVEIDPGYAEAWNNLGRARMMLQEFEGAETAFGKALELAPDTSLYYSELAWSLTAQRKNAEVIALLEKRIAAAPADGEAHYRLGSTYIILDQPGHAVLEFEKAVSLLPRSAPVQFDLGSAYFQIHQSEKAVAVLERAICLNDSELFLNNAAYLLSENNTRLDLAESWSLRSIEKVEMELSQVSLSRIQPQTAQLLASLSAYWDTLAWIKFQKTDFAGAEKYERAAWQLADDSTMGFHLGRIYELQKRTNDAIGVYTLALAAIQDPHEQADIKSEIHNRLVALLGEGLIDKRVAESRPQLKQRRSVSIANPAGAQGIAQYLLVIGPDSKVLEIEAMSPDLSLAPLMSPVRVATVPLSFPDGTIKKLPATGILSCSRSDQPCVFTVLSVEAAFQAFPSKPFPTQVH